MDTTWDGLPITPEWPLGATVVVRRTDGYLLLLHRAMNGIDYEGDWAWTTPAGARQPGEPILAGALRELAEEAGLTHIDSAPPGLVPVDLTGRWALFTVEVGADAAVTLVDVEHDKFEWVRPPDAYPRMHPALVRSGIRRALATSVDPVTFRPLQRADLAALVTWQNTDHVRRWWTDAVADIDAAEKKYGPCIDAPSPTAVDVIVIGGRPIGFIQTTPLSADDEYLAVAGWVSDGGADAVAIDYAIGDPSLIGWGTGTRVIWSYLRDVVLWRFPDTQFVVADPEAANVASIRACEKAGFRRIFDFEPEPSHAEPPAPRHALCLWERARVFGRPPTS